jgi:6-phosphogluconolactonase
MEPIIHIFNSPEDLADKFAGQLITWMNETTRDIFHLVLSGGKTPSLLFSILAEKYINEVPWNKLHFWWGDERMVSPDNPESNFGVANRLLFSLIELSQYQIHQINGDADPFAEVKRYGQEMRSLVPIINGWPAFDLIMLGLGEDGHTASIFPGQQLFDSDETTGIAFHPVTGQKRITLTGKVLNNAEKVAFLLTGESKAGIFNEIRHNYNRAQNYPASKIHPRGELHWFVDKACIL